MLYTYDKVHTYIRGTTDEAALGCGQGWYVAELDTAGGPVTVGSFICYDREHPEAARELMLRGAEVVLMPTACTIREFEIDELRSRCATNGLALCQANYAHPAFNGGSAVIGPEGEVLLWDRTGDQGVYVAEIDVAALRAFRATSRGRSLTDPPVTPDLCRLRRSAAFSGATNAYDNPYYI